MCIRDRRWARGERLVVRELLIALTTNVSIFDSECSLPLTIRKHKEWFFRPVQGRHYVLATLRNRKRQTQDSNPRFTAPRKFAGSIGPKWTRRMTSSHCPRRVRALARQESELEGPRVLGNLRLKVKMPEDTETQEPPGMELSSESEFHLLGQSVPVKRCQGISSPPEYARFGRVRIPSAWNRSRRRPPDHRKARSSPR